MRILGAWNTGARQFTANKPIRTPDDLEGLKMRFPPSPQFLMNAAAMGASPVEVAYDELYLALQQGIVDGQENPLTNIQAINLPEVQDYVSLSSHQLSSNLVVIGKVWDTLSAEQQAALTAAVEKAMVEEPKCVVEAEKAILDEFRPAAPWRSSRTSTARRSAPRRSPTSGRTSRPSRSRSWTRSGRRRSSASARTVPAATAGTVRMRLLRTHAMPPMTRMRPCLTRDR